MHDRASVASIIVISSASTGPPLSRVLGYGVAKSGVNNLTQYLARELADDRIRVNAIIPGFFPAEQNRTLLTQERVDSIVGHTALRARDELTSFSAVVRLRSCYGGSGGIGRSAFRGAAASSE